MQRVTKITLMISIFILIAGTLIFIDFFVFTISEDHVSVGKIMCKSMQREIYLVLLEYKDKHSIVPRNLETLEQEGYIQNKYIYCAKTSRRLKVSQYQYFPEHFGDPNKVLISQSIQGYGLKGWRWQALNPVIVFTMGDGTIDAKNVTSKDFF